MEPEEEKETLKFAEDMTCFLQDKLKENGKYNLSIDIKKEDGFLKYTSMRLMKVSL